MALAVGTGALVLTAPVGAAQAHPLGNVTVNHATHVELSPTGVSLTAVVDRAEIPTAQALQDIAPDGAPSAAQLASAASTECGELAGAVRVSVDGDRLGWTAGSARLETVPGAAGLPTLRLTCVFDADADLGGKAVVEVENEHLADRVGWREMTADGDGIRLVDSPVPTESGTDGLRSYPEDLLASPLDVRAFTVRTEPGTTTGSGASIDPGSGDPFSTAMAALDRRLEDLIGDRGLTPLAGTLAVLLAVLLGCGHALLPGHGKTVMAAYLAGRSGRRRDAVTVGATVTATHTVGVLALGLAISVSSSIAGDQVLRWLGVVSGLLVAGIGLGMLRGALTRGRARTSPAQVHRPNEVAPVAALPAVVPALAGPGGAVALRAQPSHDHDHDHLHDHDHDHDHPHPHDHDHGDGGWWSGGHSHGPGGHTHGPGEHAHDRAGRGGLIGMGIAGGLVPSPSALVVLLASVGLGRTVFGVLLVLAYGVGMAGTLTAVGLVLVRLRGRVEQRMSGLHRDRWLVRLAVAMPVVTAALVFGVGITLVVRGVVLA